MWLLALKLKALSAAIVLSVLCRDESMATTYTGEAGALKLVM